LHPRQGDDRRHPAERLNMMRQLAILVVAAAACGPKPTPAPVPVLPGDGTANVAKPPDRAAGQQANDPWAGRTDLITPPAPKPPSRVELPAIEKMQLANGLTVFAIKSSRLPVVS